MALLGHACAGVQASIPVELATKTPGELITMKADAKVGTVFAYGKYESYHLKETPLKSVTQGGLISKDLDFDFDMIGADADGWKIECKTSETSKPGVGSNPEEMLSRELSCKLVGPSNDIWRLRFSASRAGTDFGLGELRATRKRMTIHGLSAVANKTQIAGYGMALLSRPIGAVQTVGTTKGWIVPDLPGRLKSAIAASMTALIVFDDVSRR
jgi:hypothetical protein